MDGLECSEIYISNLEFSGRIDSEYYQKKHLEYENMIQKNNSCPMGKLCHFLIGPFGSAYDTSTYVDKSDYRYVRGQDVKPFFLQDTSPRYMNESDYHRLRKYALMENDILISVVGTLGNASIVQGKELPAIFSCKSTAVRVDSVDPYYLLSYLNSKYGRQLLLRKERGAIQKGLNLDDLKALDVPVFSKEFQMIVRGITLTAPDIMNKGNLLYEAAQKKLLSALYYSPEKISSKAISEKKLSESFAVSGRLDAEYYQPKYDDLLTILSKQFRKPLGQLVSMMKSIEPGSEYYGDTGIPFIRVSDVSKTGINNPSIMIPESIEPNIDRLYPKKDTILFSKDGSVGIAYKITEDMKTVTSSALLHLRVNNTSEILPDYLTLVLNSEIVQLQAERDASGAIIQHWKPSDIEKVVIPILPYDMQLEITKKVQQSFLLRKKANDLIQIAVKAVELAIEDSEEVATKWLEENTRLLEGNYARITKI